MRKRFLNLRTATTTLIGAGLVAIAALNPVPASPTQPSDHAAAGVVASQPGSTNAETAAGSLGSPELAKASIMQVSEAFCGTTPDGQGWFRVSVGDWGSMQYVPNKYSLYPQTQLSKGSYYTFTIDPDRMIVYDVQYSRYPAFDLNPCWRIGA